MTSIVIFNPDFVDPATANIIGATAVFSAWFNYLLYLQRFNSFGIYIVMFLEILSTLLRVLFVFSVLFVAFGLSFYILMRHVVSYLPLHLAYWLTGSSLFSFTLLVTGCRNREGLLQSLRVDVESVNHDARRDWLSQYFSSSHDQ